MKTGFTLATSVVLAIAIIALVHQCTTGKIDNTQTQFLNNQIEQLLLPESYDNNPANSVIHLSSPELGSNEKLPIYRASLAGNPSGSVITAVAPDGYNGDIHLLIGLSYSGNVIGVRVTKHNETPGLGDDIDIKRSDWISAFDNLQTGQMAMQQWQVKRDGGSFDQFTGATITPRAVVHAVHRVVRWHAQAKEIIYAPATAPANAQ